MQRIAFNQEAAVRAGRDFQFLVRMVEELGTLAQRRFAVHCRTQRRAGTIGADQGRVEMDVVCLVVTVIDEACVAGIEIDRVQATVEMEARAGFFGQLQQGGVEVLAMHRPDHFAVIASVTLQLRFSAARMHHAPAHHHGLGHDRVFHAGLTQCIAPALGQGQIDGATRLIVGDARITAAFVERDLPALTGQQNGQEGTGQAGADDGETAGGGSGQLRGVPLDQLRRAQFSTSSTKR
ncbi:hypothetical protein D3C81_1486720 [compost metagenome]